MSKFKIAFCAVLWELPGDLSFVFQEDDTGEFVDIRIGYRPEYIDSLTFSPPQKLINMIKEKFLGHDIKIEFNNTHTSFWEV